MQYRATRNQVSRLASKLRFEVNSSNHAKSYDYVPKETKGAKGWKQLKGRSDMLRRIFP
ncbi:MAG: hypothetical protein A49_21110 [Methyloceanibacter sp.]|nr:MAG: hypothetical protein A49_21110 [Methyloceanibacter sp.]